MLSSMASVTNAAGISDITEESALRKFRKRLDPKILDALPAAQSIMTVGNSVPTAAADAVGMPESRASKHCIVQPRHFGTENAIAKGYTKLTLPVCVHTKAYRQRTLRHPELRI